MSKYRTYVKKRTWKKKRSFRGRRYTKRRVPLPIGFPKSRLVKLKYCQEISINAGAGLIASHVFRASSLYDPDVTGGGHQPLSFDQWMQVYDHFTVIGAKIKVVPAPTGTTPATNPAYFGIILSDNGTSMGAFSSVEHLLESRQFGKAPGLAGQSDPQFGKNTINPSVSKTFSAKKFFSKKDIVGSAEYKGSAVGNPTENAFFEVFAASVRGNDPSALGFLVTIEYIAVFSEPKQIAQS